MSLGEDNGAGKKSVITEDLRRVDLIFNQYISPCRHLLAALPGNFLQELVERRLTAVKFSPIVFFTDFFGS